MAEAGEAIERLLLAEGKVKRAATARRRALACIACHVCREPKDGPTTMNGYGVKKCVGEGATHILELLKTTGALEGKVNLAQHMSGAAPRLLAPTDTPVGQAFFDRANAPDTCFSGHELPPLTPSAHTSPEPTS